MLYHNNIIVCVYPNFHKFNSWKIDLIYAVHILIVFLFTLLVTLSFMCLDCNITFVMASAVVRSGAMVNIISNMKLENPLSFFGFVYHSSCTFYMTHSL